MRLEGGRRTAAAIGVVFFVNGTVFASWIPRIPEVQGRLSIGPSTLGLVLAGVGSGGLLGTLASPRLIARWGSRGVAVTTGALAALALTGVAVAPAAWALALVLLVAGFNDAATDIAMNELGVREQRRSGRSIMNRLHAGWSLGTLSAAIIATVVAAAGVGVGPHLLTVALVGVALLALAFRHLPAGLPPPVERAPRRVRFGVAAALLPLAFAAAVVEGVPGEWSGVFLAEVHDLGPGAVGFGFTAFALGMLIGRLAGDQVVDRVGPAATWRVATVVVLVGVATLVVGPVAAISVVGFGLTGLGVSVLFPEVYRLAGDLTVVDSAAGLSLMSIGARIGFLSGPVLTGTLAELGDLRLAFVVLVAVGLATIATARLRLTPYDRARADTR